jgi:hypothetical protein
MQRQRDRSTFGGRTCKSFLKQIAAGTSNVASKVIYNQEFVGLLDPVDVITGLYWLSFLVIFTAGRKTMQ